jgi:hypothetical protein
MVRIIRTRYLPATDYKGSRIAAVDITTGTRIVESFDHGAHEPFDLVADKLITKLSTGRRVRTAKPLGSVESPGNGRRDRFHVYQLEFTA